MKVSPSPAKSINTTAKNTEKKIISPFLSFVFVSLVTTISFSSLLVTYYYQNKSNGQRPTSSSSSSAATLFNTNINTINQDFVPELTCGAKKVESLNEEYLHDVLQELSNQTFFRLFRVDLTRECKFWKENEDDDNNNNNNNNNNERSCSASFVGSSNPSEDGLYYDNEDNEDSKNKQQQPPTMCSLSTEPNTNLFGGSAPMTTTTSFGYSIPKQPISDPVDKTITSKEDKSLLKNNVDDDVDDCSKNQTSPKFWLDICSADDRFKPSSPLENTIGHGVSGENYINLRLNPERWTGYNGSHVWKAIYEENCLKGAKKEDGLCYEERVLYRLLSGMHASVNIHVALHANPPTNENEEWLPDPLRFAQLFENHPERLKNLHFSFVVMLRALRKATPALAKFPTELGQDLKEDEKTRQLKMALLALPQVLGKPCEDVFNAFDEARLFSDVGNNNVASEIVASLGTGSSSSNNSVKNGSDKIQFKDIFRNITEVIDCVACQKCRLHGKLQILGIGTALKILLLPEQVLMNEDVITRSEFVSMINTIAKFSKAIRAASHFAAVNNSRRTN